MNNKLVITNYENCIGNFLFSEEGLEQLYLHDNDAIVGNIYVGKVKKVVKNLNAAFVEYKQGHMAFLPLEQTSTRSVKEGDEIPLQIIKAAVKTKDPVATQKLSISGLYCVVAITTATPTIQYSKKLTASEKGRIEEALQHYVMKQTLSFDIIIRTSIKALSQIQTLENEITELSAKLQSIVENSQHRTCYSMLYQEKNHSIQQALKIPCEAYDEIVTDLKDYYDAFANCITNKEIRFYQDESYSLKKLYSIETKVNELLQKKVYLKNGGNIVIESTEAMTVVDVNTGKNVQKKEAQQLAYETNLEAAKELAKQLILRNLSGIIIIDFINMSSQKHQEKVIEYLKVLLKKDVVQCNFIDMTPLGLVEITRRKISPPIQEILQKNQVKMLDDKDMLC